MTVFSCNLNLVNRLVALLITILVIILISALGYLVLQNQKLIKQLSQNLSQASPSSIITTSPTPAISPSPILTVGLTQDAIKTNIASKNYPGLISYMNNPVEVILQATECCGPQTPQEAVDQLSYIDDGVPFDFDQNTNTVKNLKAKNAQLADKFIGISKSQEHLVAFGLNNQNKIADILISVSWKLYSY